MALGLSSNSDGLTTRQMGAPATGPAPDSSPPIGPHVTSVALSAPSSILSVAGSPITGAGTLALSLATQTANRVWAGPTTGAAAAPAFRALVLADIPDLSSVYQPLDADLTAIAALTTASYGRALLTLTSQADLTALLALNESDIRAAGTAYTLTTTPALLALGTTVPRVTLNAAGTWILLPSVYIRGNGATFAANRTVTCILRRTNNTAVDVANSNAVCDTNVVATTTYAIPVVMPAIVYTTTNTNDIIEVWGSVSVLPTAGSVDCIRAQLVAFRISP